MLQLIITLVVWAACAYGCYTIAQKNGQNAILAAVLGLLFGVFALAVYAILSLLKKK